MSDRQLKGIGVSPGIGVGAAIVVRWTMPEVPHRVVPRSQVEKEVRRLRAAVRDVKRYLQAMKAKTEDRGGAEGGGRVAAPVAAGPPRNEPPAPHPTRRRGEEAPPSGARAQPAPGPPPPPPAPPPPPR